MLDLQNRLYEQGEKHLSAFDMARYLTPLKRDERYEWLCEISNQSLCLICNDLDKAYKKFFSKQGGYPKFKSKKKSKPAYPVRADRIYFIDNKLVKIEKLGKVKCKTDFKFPYGREAKFSNPRISNKNNKWILSFGMECENQTLQLTDKTMGIDLGVKEQAVVAFGDEQIIFHNINKSKKMRKLERKAKHIQRSVSRKYETGRKTTGKYQKSNNIVKEEQELQRILQRMSNIRNNYLHQTTHALVAMLPCKVVMEDLNVQGMMKNKHLAKAIQQQNFYEFTRQMQYKCEWNGIEFVKADRFYPSSKTCSCCGEIKKDLRLKDRVFRCNSCGNVIDRDLNAALNLSRYVA